MNFREMSFGKLSVADRCGIEDVVALYGHVIDEAAWSELDLVFTEGCVFESSIPGRPVWRGLEELTQGFAGVPRPVAHHTTNIWITGGADGAATSVSKWYVIPRSLDAPVRSGDYVDTLTRTDGGWRIVRRIASERERTQ